MAKKIQVETGWDRNMRSCLTCGCVSVVLGPVAFLLLAGWGASLVHQVPEPTTLPNRPASGGPVEASEPAAAPVTADPSPAVDDPTLVFPASQLRTWTSADGRFSVDAHLAEYDPEARTAVLEKVDGQRITIELNSLTIDDRNHIREQARGAN